MFRTALILSMLAACGGGGGALDAGDLDGAGPIDARAPADARVDAVPPIDAMPVPDVPPGTPDAGLGPLAAATIGGHLELAICSWWVRCGLVPDDVTCLTAFDPALGQIPQLIAYEAAGRLTFDLTAAMACVADTAAQSCSWFDATPPASCDGVFTGAVAEGGPCIVNEECSGDAVCVQPTCEAECCEGVCTSPPAPLPVGAACGGTAPCEATAWCDDGVCAARGAAGEACVDFDSCAAGTYCRLDFSTGAGTCTLLVDEGGACDPTVAWPSGGCRRFDDWCNPATSQCERRLAPGESCASAPSDRCLPYATCAGGLCVERPALGDPCAAVPCLGQLVCSTGACVFPDPAEVCP